MSALSASKTIELEEKLRAERTRLKALVATSKGERWLRKTRLLLAGAMTVGGIGKLERHDLVEFFAHATSMGVKTEFDCIVLAESLCLMLSVPKDSILMTYFLWGARWSLGGFPVLTMSRQQAADIALSDVPPEMANETMSPWDAFLIVVEGDFCETCDGTVSRVHVVQSRFRTDDSWSFQAFPGGFELTSTFRTGAQLASWRDHESGPVPMYAEVEKTQEDERTISAIGRLVIGSCVAVTEYGARPELDRGGRRKRRKWSFVATEKRFRLGSPVEIDFSNEVQSYISGERNGVRKSRWVVRGHWRNQPCGVGRYERRKTWVRPHWAGPNEAPVLVRDYKIGERKKAAE